MGRKLDALLRRDCHKTSKFKTLLGHLISRLFTLKNQRKIRCSQCRNDVAQLLVIGQQERALRRVEHVIQDQNMLGAFVIIEEYCHLLTESAVLIQYQKDCPEELKEAIASLIFAASRCGELPELQEIRFLFTTWYGKEFAASAVQLHDGCGVNPKLIGKISSGKSSLEIRLKVLKEIAHENTITLNIDEAAFEATKERSNFSRSHQKQPGIDRSFMSGNADNSSKATTENDSHGLRELDQKDVQLSRPMNESNYASAASAAQAAFESANYAAAEAKVAVELSGNIDSLTLSQMNNIR